MLGCAATFNATIPASAARTVFPAEGSPSTQGAMCRRVTGRVRVASLSGIHLVPDAATSLTSHAPPGTLASPYDGTLYVLPISTTVVKLANGRGLPAAGQHIAVDGFDDGSYFLAESIGDFTAPVRFSPTDCIEARR